MKNKLVLLSIFFFLSLISAKAEQASLSVSNSSDYTMTVKIMKCSGGLYQTLYIPPKQTRIAYFSKTGWFYTKTKAEKTLSILYKKDENCFEIVNDSRGYSQASITYYISEHGGNAGQSISKSEFEKDN